MEQAVDVREHGACDRVTAADRIDQSAVLETRRSIASLRVTASSQPLHSLWLRRRAAHHPVRRFAPSIRNAVFTWPSRRTDACGLTGKIVPQGSFASARSNAGPRPLRDLRGRLGNWLGWVALRSAPCLSKIS